MSNPRVARYRLRVQRIEELVVEVEAGSIQDARFAVEMQDGTLCCAVEGRLGVRRVETANRPAKFRVVGKHEYLNEDGSVKRV